jgi:hypothetical protein
MAQSSVGVYTSFPDTLRTKTSETKLCYFNCDFSMLQLRFCDVATMIKDHF